MGAEASALQSIDSLNRTLSSIEERLGALEDGHIHHERTIGIDNCVLVSGKKIACRSGVSMMVGPIIGLVSHNSARIVIETDADTELTFHSFLADEITTESRYQKSEVSCLFSKTI